MGMIYTILTMKNSDNDQLASVSAVADASGNLVSRTLYQPWGTTRYSQGTNPTDYAYTGQIQEGDIYFYQSRWYDPQLGRFMQADTIIPLQVQGTQAFDRYAYVNNNPLRYTDPSGFYIIAGWDNTYLQEQVGNTCGVVALAMGLSVLYQKQVTQTNLQPLFPQTKPTALFPDGLGVPPGQLSATINIAFGQGVIATRQTNSTVEELKQNIYDNKPTLILIQLPEKRSIGHYLLAIGYSDEEGFIFADPHKRIHHEGGFVKYWDKDRGYSSFEEIWSVDYWSFLQPKTMITLEYNTSAIYGTFLQFVNYQSPIHPRTRGDHLLEIR